MSTVTIYQFGTTIPRATVKPNDSSEQRISLMREDILVLNFPNETAISFRIGDYCTFANRLYQINKLPTRTRTSKDRIDYQLTMESEMYDLAKVSFMFLDSTNKFTEPVFPLRGRLQDFADLIIFNVKRVFPYADWILGQVEQTDYMNIQFSAQNCLQVLQTLATTFNTEYIVEGKTINLYQRQTSNGLVLEYGKDKALLSLTEAPQDASNVITRLYAFGSTRNITSTYRGGSQRLRMGNTNYLEKNTSLYNVSEFTMLFDGSNGTQEIYPHRTGVVSTVDDPFNFRDASMDFDVNDNLLPGVTAQIVFNTGLLAGYTFDLSAYDNATKKFTILKNIQETNIDVPSASYTPVVGDTYVITQIELPQTYITQAESNLKAAAQDYLNKHSIPPVKFSANCNDKWFKDNGKELTIATTSNILDAGLNVNRTTRITSFTRNVNNVFKLTMELADTVTAKSIIVKLINGL